MNVKHASVLLVEDEPLLREAMGAWLARVAGRAFSAENGAEALRILAANRIDLVISDVRMPVMGGAALLEKINRSGLHRPAVIFLTGYSDLSARQAYALGADAMLEKPVDRDEMLRVMRRSLAGPAELWRHPPSAPPHMKLKARFAGLTSALEGREGKRLAFGRKGFCIEPAGGLHEGPVEFALDFKADRQLLSGQGLVRWTAPEEQQAGIEITHLHADGCAWLVKFLKHYAPLASIPAAAQASVQRYRAA
ncbi:MAG TPA: response regulator [Candidatus Angelobacter sp.]|nr:response regulator [Candidatus Angelobacter sp.]